MTPVPDGGEPAKLWKLLGVTREFSRADILIFALTMIWTFGWFALFAVMTVIYYSTGISDGGWAKFWQFKLILLLYSSASSPPSGS